MRMIWVYILLAAVGVLLAVLADRAFSPKTGRLLISRDVEIIMACRDTGVEVICRPEGHKFRGKYEAWVE